MGTLIGLVIAVLDIWAILNIVQSKTSTINKAFWAVVILFLPLLGLIIWYFVGPGTKRM